MLFVFFKYISYYFLNYRSFLFNSVLGVSSKILYNNMLGLSIEVIQYICLKLLQLIFTYFLFYGYLYVIYCFN